MSAHRFPRKLNGDAELDLCFACQGIWFDDCESPQLAPAGVIVIHLHRDDQRLPLANPLRCRRSRSPTRRPSNRPWPAITRLR